MEGFTLFKLVAEVRGRALGARVERVRLTDPWTLAVKLYPVRRDARMPRGSSQDLSTGVEDPSTRRADEEATSPEAGRGRSHSAWLVISVEPQWPRLFLVPHLESVGEDSRTSETCGGPLPTPFLLRVRRHVRGARVSAIEQERYDRIVRFVFRRPSQEAEEELASGAASDREWREEWEPDPEILDESQTRWGPRGTSSAEESLPQEVILVAELFGRAGNLLLLDASGHVLDSLRVSAEDRHMPGRLYTPPASSRGDPRALDRESFQALWSAGTSLADVLRRAVEGFGSLYAAEVEARWHRMRREHFARSEGSCEGSGGTSQPVGAVDLDLAYAAFCSVREDLLRRPAEPLLYSRRPLEELDLVRSSPRDVIFSVIPLALADGWFLTRFDSLSRAAQAYYDLVRAIERFCCTREMIRRHLSEQIEKRHRLLCRLRADRHALGDPDMWRRWGELLLMNAHVAVRTPRGFRVTDHYDPAGQQIEIPSDAKTPQEAAQECFRRYRKARQGHQIIAARHVEVEREMARLRSLAARLDEAETLAALEVIARELGELRGPREALRRFHSPEGPSSRKKARGARADLSGIARFRSSEGFEIWVGRSAQDNERLTFRLSAPHDIWLHAADYPGSHVIIRREKRQEVPFRTVVEAAQLAAFFSDARHSSKVVVNYTERKFVSKIPRSKPGLVRVSEFRSLTVEPRVSVERMIE